MTFSNALHSLSLSHSLSFYYKKITFVSWGLAHCEFFYSNVIWMNIASSNSESFTTRDLKRIEHALIDVNTPSHLVKNLIPILSVFRPNATELNREMAVVSFRIIFCIFYLTVKI